MIEYIKGKVSSLTPTTVVLDNQGMGYLANISLNTFSAIQQLEVCQLYIYEAIRDDAYQLFGFYRREERELFLLLIGVSGVGANTARMILSSMTVDELKQVIATDQVAVLQGVKGIGSKTAQRILIDLKDKILKLGGTTTDQTQVGTAAQQVRFEALSALQMLGFQPVASQKVVNKLLSEQPNLPVEQVIKAALKML